MAGKLEPTLDVHRSLHASMGNSHQCCVEPPWHCPAILVLALWANMDDVLATECLDPKAVHVREIYLDFVVRGNGTEPEVQPSTVTFNFVRGERWSVVLDGKTGEGVSEEGGAVLRNCVAELDRLDGWVTGHLDAWFGHILG